MTTLLTSLILGQVSAAPIFDRSLAAHKALGAASVTIHTQADLEQQKITGLYKLAYIKPNQMSIRVTQAGGDRSFYVLGNKFIGYDRVYNEYLTRNAPAKATLLDKVSVVMQSLDESVQPIVEPSVMAGLYGKFRNQPGWTRTEDKQTIRLLRYTGDPKAKSGVAFFFDKKNSLLRGASFFEGKNIVVWRYEYGPKPKTIAFNPPANAIKVASFLEARPKPKYKDVDTKRVAEAASRAYDALQHVDMVISSPDGKTHIWMSSGRVRARQGAFDWVYANGALSILDNRKKRLYRGKTNAPMVSNYLAKLGARVEPIIRQMRSRENPIRVLMEPGAAIRNSGSIVLRGAPCSVLEIKGANLQVTAWVRQKDRLLQSVETRHLDKKGRVVISTTRDYEYVSLGKPLPAGTFELGRGMKAQKLSQIKKS